MKDVLQHPALIEALQKAAQAYGVSRLAAEMDKRPSTLYNALNPWGDRSTIKLGLEDALYIMVQTGDKTALQIMAREMGCVCVDINAEPDQATLEGEIVDDFQAVSALATAMRSGASVREVEAAAGAAHREIEETVTEEIVEEKPPIEFKTSEEYPGEIIYDDGEVQIVKFTQRTNTGKYTARIIQVKDPSRVVLGVTNKLGKRGQLLGDFCTTNDALAAINAGGFVDDGGHGNGGTPRHLHAVHQNDGSFHHRL